jgi:hypothetical protein
MIKIIFCDCNFDMKEEIERNEFEKIEGNIKEELNF